jgi:hypothetical protein
MITETQVENFVVANTPPKKPFLKKLFTQYLKAMVFHSTASYVFSWKSLEPFGLSGQDFRGFDPRVKLAKDVQQLTDLIAISRGARNLNFYRYVASRFFSGTDVFVLTGGLNYPRAMFTDDLRSDGTPFLTDASPTLLTDAGLIPAGYTVPAIYPDRTQSFWSCGDTTSLVNLTRAVVGDIAVIYQSSSNYIPYPIGTNSVHRLAALPPTLLTNWEHVFLSLSVAPRVLVWTSLALMTGQSTAQVGDMAIIANRGSIASQTAMFALTPLVVGDTVYRTDNTAPSVGQTAGLTAYRCISVPGAYPSTEVNWAKAETVRYGLVQQPPSTLSNWRPVNVPVVQQANGYPVTNYVSGGANPPVVVMQIPYTLASLTAFKGIFSEFLLSLAVIKQARTFILLYPRWEVTIDEIASSTGTGGTFLNVVYLQSTKIFKIDTDPIKHVDQDWMEAEGTPINATAMLNGFDYIIVTVNDSGPFFTTHGAHYGTAGESFTYTGTSNDASAGTGVVRTRVVGSRIALDKAPLTPDMVYSFTQAAVTTRNPLLGYVGVDIVYYQPVTVTVLSTSPLTVAWDIPIDSMVTHINLFQPGVGHSALVSLIAFDINNDLVGAYSPPSVTVDGQQIMRIKYTF